MYFTSSLVEVASGLPAGLGAAGRRRQVPGAGLVGEPVVVVGRRAAQCAGQLVGLAFDQAVLVLARGVGRGRGRGRRRWAC